MLSWGRKGTRRARLTEGRRKIADERGRVEKKNCLGSGKLFYRSLIEIMGAANGGEGPKRSGSSD